MNSLVYHIRLEYFNKKLKTTKIVYCFDIGTYEFIESKVSSYLKDKDFMLSGSKFLSEDIESFRIFKSRHTIDECKKIEDSKISPDVYISHTEDSILGNRDTCPEITDEVIDKVYASIHEGEKLDNRNIERSTHQDVFSRDVFIVHGHDNELKQTVARTLSTLQLNPVILHEQPNQGQTIMEKLEKAASSAGFAVILLTADDMGKAIREEEYRSRARQNVVFEMGYFIAKIGRERVMLLLENGVDKPGDLDGLVYTLVDRSGAWRFRPVQELKSAGFLVSADTLI